QLTSIIRDSLDLSDEKSFPVVQLLEFFLPNLDEKFTYEIVPIEEMMGSYAETYPEQSKIVIREDVYTRAIEGVPRDRFTIAHEIGHFILHRPGRIVLARKTKHDKIPAYKNPEWQANTFAGELLAPPQVIRGLTIQEVTLICGVSYDVAKIQLSNL